MLKMSRSLDVSRRYCLWSLCISYTVSSKQESLDPCTAWKVEGTRSLTLSASSPPGFSTRFTVHRYKKGSFPKPCPKIEGCYSRLNCETRTGLPIGSYLQPLCPQGISSPPALFLWAGPLHHLTGHSFNSCWLLLCSLHRCAVLFWTPCPWTFPTHNFPNQSLAIKMSVRDGENCGGRGGIFKKEKGKRGRCFTHTGICVDFLHRGLNVCRDVLKRAWRWGAGANFSEHYLERPGSTKELGPE